MKRKFTPLREIFPLTPETIDTVSLRISEALENARFDRRDCIRFRFSTETILCLWMEKLGEGFPCTIALTKRFGRIQLTLSAVGPAVPPDREENAFFEGMVSEFSVLQSLGLTGGYRYENGKNIVNLSEPGRSPGLWPLLFSLGLAVGAGLFLRTSLPDFSASLSSLLLTPLFDSLLEFITAMEGPMVFLAILTGVCGMGSTHTLEQVGKRLVSRFFCLTFLTAGGLALLTLLFLPISSSSAMGESNLSHLISLFLGILPTDIVTPFQTHNALQIVFLALLFGIGLLLLGRSVRALQELLEQLHTLVHTLMSILGRFIPFLVFLCVLDLFLADSMEEVREMLPVLLAVVVLDLLLMLIYPTGVALRLGRSARQLYRDLAPSLLIAITTASSVAATPAMTEVCRHKLKINESLSSFGLHLGDVLFKLGAVIEYFILTVGIAWFMEVPMSLTWLLTAALLSGILSIVSPPVFGSGAVVYGILFSQLGISEDGVALAILFSFLLGYFTTAANILVLQSELWLNAHKLHLLDTTETEPG